MSSRSSSRPGPGDSDVEIEVIQPRPSKPRRAVNPEIDEVIHSGEISVPRSMVIRSSASMPKIELADPDEEKTEMTRLPALRPPAPRRRSAMLVWLLVVLVPAAAGAAAFLIMNDRANNTAAAPSVAPTTAAAPGVDLQACAQIIGTALDGGMKAALVRAESIAMSPTLRNGIMTDAATVQDQARTGDTTYNLKPGEIVEVWRVAGGARTLWLRLPEDTVDLGAPTSGKMKVSVRGGEAYALASAPITDQKGNVAGELAFAVPIDLAAVKKRMPGQVARASLVGLGALVVLVDGARGGKQVSVPIDTESKLPIAIEASVR